MRSHRCKWRESATSYHTDAKYTTEFEFAGTAAEFAEQLRSREIRVFEQPGGSPAASEYHLTVPAPDVCFGDIQAILKVEERAGRLHVFLRELSHKCPERGDEKVWLFEVFRKAVVLPLELRAP